MKFLTLYFLSSLSLLLLLSCSEGGGSGGSSLGEPKLAITDAPPITLANAENYGVGGTCTRQGETVAVKVGSLGVGSAICSEELTWQVTADDVTHIIGETVVITASELQREVEREVVRDVTLPVVGIHETNAAINSINQESYQLRGSCDEAKGEVVVNMSGVSAVAICDGANWEANAIDLRGLPPGMGQVAVTADLADALGNPADQASLSLARDIIPPQVGITSPPVINRNSINSYALEGSCEHHGQGVVTVRVGELLAGDIDCGSDGWRLELAASELEKLPEQNGIIILVEHRDAAGNVGRDETGRVDKDLVAPEATVTSPLPSISPTRTRMFWRERAVRMDGL